MSKLALGTVQFGLNYGVNNNAGMVSKDQVYAILDLAQEHGIQILDTAYNYGESEAVIGEYFKESGVAGKFKVVTKLPHASVEKARSILEESFKRLEVASLYGCIFHNFQSYKECPELLTLLEEYKREGKIEKIGFSLYYPHELQYLLDHHIQFDLVQFPYSVFDQRFAPLLPLLKEHSIEVHVRSVFLQGLVFKKPTELPQNLKGLTHKLEALHQLAKQSGLTVAALCLNFGLADPLINNVIMGVDNTENLAENIRVSQKSGEVEGLLSELKTLREDDEMIIVPTNWKK